MGQSSYYSGKGSTQYSGKSSSSSSHYSGKGGTQYREEYTGRHRRSNSSYQEIIRLLEELDECRDNIDYKREELENAERRFNQTERKLIETLNKLDPEMRARISKMLNGFDRDYDHI